MHRTPTLRPLLLLRPSPVRPAAHAAKLLAALTSLPRRRACAGMTKHLGPIHPRTAHASLRAGLLCVKARQLRRALPLLKRARIMLRVTHGPDHELTRTATEMVQVLTDTLEAA